MYDTQKPDVEELIHYGKKGMKWGVRRGSDGVRPIARTMNESKMGKKQNKRALDYGAKKAAKKAAKPTNEDIHNARGRTNLRVNKLDDLAVTITTSRPGTQEHTRALKEYDRITAEGMNDAATARRLTTGEKVVNTMLLTYIGGTALSVAAVKLKGI